MENTRKQFGAQLGGVPESSSFVFLRFLSTGQSVDRGLDPVSGTYMRDLEWLCSTWKSFSGGTGFLSEVHGLYHFACILLSASVT